MMWSTNSDKYPGGGFSCDVCHTSNKCADGRWYCEACSSDICGKCKSPMKLKNFPTCAKAHPMLWTLNNEGYGGTTYSCDLCHKSNNISLGRWFCAECKSDLCPACLPAPKPFALPPVDGKKHTLTWNISLDGYPGGGYSCDGCHKSNKCGAGRWGCAQCKYDMCPMCSPAPFPMAAPPKDVKNHGLIWNNSEEGYMGGGYSCDLCKTSHKCAEGRWHCKECKFDACAACEGISG